jgi:hypothetical protein
LAFTPQYRPSPLFLYVQKLEELGDARMYVLKGLKFKWLENVQMRGESVSAETTEVADRALNDGVQVQNPKHLA